MASLIGGVVQGPPPPPTDRGWGGGDGPDGRGADRRTSFIGLVILLVSTGIVFIALLVAFLARRAMGDDWISMHKPGILWANTAVLILSSVALDISRFAASKVLASDRASTYGGPQPPRSAACSSSVRPSCGINCALRGCMSPPIPAAAFSMC